MLMPKRVERRRVFRGRMNGKAMRGNFLAYGEFGLVAFTSTSWVTSQQNRSGSYCPDPLHQAWRSGIDQDLPRQACYQEAR